MHLEALTESFLETSLLIPSLSFPISPPKLPVSPCKELVHTWVPQLLRLLPEEEPLDSSTLRATEACIQESHSTKEKKEALNGLCNSPAHPLCSYTTGPRSKQVETITSQLLAGRGLTTYFPRCCLRVQLLAAYILVLTVVLPLGTPMGLGTYSTTGSH